MYNADDDNDDADDDNDDDDDDVDDDDDLERAEILVLPAICLVLFLFF